MRDELIYNQYANWKLEHSDLIKYLREKDSDLILRFKHIFEVTDYLYDQLIDDPNYSEEQDQIFQTGFYYLFDQIEKITELLKEVYQNDIKALKNISKDVNLLLSTIDFENELLSAENYDVNHMNKLLDFETDVMDKLKHQQSIPNEMYVKLDEMTYKMFQEMNVDFYPIQEIFFEIADELGII
ncbi:MAG: hypothetical protein WCR19_02555 [Acholeplasmataceae bacterium]